LNGRLPAAAFAHPGTETLAQRAYTGASRWSGTITVPTGRARRRGFLPYDPRLGLSVVHQGTSTRSGDLVQVRIPRVIWSMKRAVKRQCRGGEKKTAFSMSSMNSARARPGADRSMERARSRRLREALSQAAPDGSRRAPVTRDTPPVEDGRKGQGVVNPAQCSNSRMAEQVLALNRSGTPCFTWPVVHGGISSSS